MRSLLIVGGGHINGSKQVSVNHGIDPSNHGSRRKAGNSSKVIPHASKIIVVITNWISHAISHEAQCDQARHLAHLHAQRLDSAVLLSLYYLCTIPALALH